MQLNVDTLILGCRNVSKGKQAKSDLIRTAKKNISVHVWQVDMASFASVKSFAEKIRTELPRLDALVANAGISTNEYRTAETFEQTLTVNVVSTFLLSLLCLPSLRKTAVQQASPTHLTVVGSLVHYFADHSQLEQPPAGKVLKTLSDEKQADMASRYFLSKLIVLLYIQELAKHSPQGDLARGPSVIINCPNPGWCKTGLFRQDDGGAFARNLLKLIGRTGEVGARTLTSAIAAGSDSHGCYMTECRVKPAGVWVRSQGGQAVQKKIWKELVDTLEDISPGISSVLS